MPLPQGSCMTPLADEPQPTDTRNGSPLEVLRSFSSSASPASAARSPTSAISATSSSCAGAGSTSRPMPISSRCASSCRARPAARSAFSIGLLRAGYRGGLAAWTGFTLPSAIVLVLFAYGVGALSGPVGTGLLHGLKLVAVAIVAQAVWGMARTLCPDRERASIAVVAALIILFSTVVGRADRRRSCSAAIAGSCCAAARRRPDGALSRCRCRVARALVALTAFFAVAGRACRSCADV